MISVANYPDCPRSWTKSTNRRGPAAIAAAEVAAVLLSITDKATECRDC